MRLLLIALVVALLLGWVLSTLPPAQRKRWVLGIGVGALLGVLAWLALTGRLHWLAALVASMLPFMRRLLPLLRYVPLLRGLATRFRQQSGQQHRQQGRSGRQSRVDTAWLSMTLDHDSGAMDGEILQGPWQGRRLAELDFGQLHELFTQLTATDQESADLLQAYLEREHVQQWQESQTRAGAGAARDGGGGDESLSDREEALRILGLQEGASVEEIIAAHRRLMQKLHPDRGGSDYLAAKVNAAKDLLLGESHHNPAA